ncbi:hypothetical protein [Spirillospora albida]|uniref:hypothetical protein n=1 Tax=Spirillospora albida TaxID=58123 RepID=UPI0012F9B32F|nr:hypothetical protein [Spirillospora albida]
MDPLPPRWPWRTPRAHRPRRSKTLDGRFFKGTVEEAVEAARRKVEELWTALEQVDD